MKQKQPLILLGGGGHCKACIDIIELTNTYSILGILDVKEKIGETINGYPIIGSDSDIEELAVKCKSFFITIGQIKNANRRKQLFEKLKELNLEIPSFISPTAYVSKNAKIDEGTIVMHQAVVNTDASIGCNCILNSKSLIEHEVRIGHHSHISTNAVVNGQTIIGDSCFVGSSSILYNNIEITDFTIIAAGSIVRKDISASGTYSWRNLEKKR